MKSRIAVWCKTSEDAEELLGILSELGFSISKLAWSGWEIFGRSTCYKIGIDKKVLGGSIYGAAAMGIERDMRFVYIHEDACDEDISTDIITKEDISSFLGL